MIRSFEFSVLRASPPAAEKSEGLNQLLMVKELSLNQLSLCTEAFIKAQKDDVWRASGLMIVYSFEESGASREASSPFPHTLLSHLAVPELYLL